MRNKNGRLTSFSLGIMVAESGDCRENMGMASILFLAPAFMIPGARKPCKQFRTLLRTLQAA